MSELEEQVLFGEPPMRDEARLQAQLAAVELLLARQDRDVAHHDILIATSLELLAGGPLTTQQLMGRISEAWPGLRLLTAELEAALFAAATVRNVELINPEGGPAAWSLLPAGRTELAESAQRGLEIIQRFRSQVADELRRRTGECRLEDLNELCEIVIRSIRVAVGQFFEVKDPAAVETAGGWLRIRSGEGTDIASWVSDRVTDRDRADTITSIALAALDQSSAIGSEMVHHLVLGHLLYVFMARPDDTRAAGNAGPLLAEVLLVDTPMLFRLADAPHIRQPLMELLGAAQRAGMRVVVDERTLEEFERHLISLEQRDIPALEKALRQGASPAVLAGLQSGSKLPQIWLRWREGRPVGSGEWQHFRAHLQGIEGPRNLLLSLRVDVSSHPVAYDAAAVALRESLADKLRERTTVNGVRGRGEVAIQHDVEMLAAVADIRRVNPASEKKVWPGAFCLTSDRQLDELFDEIYGQSAFPATVSLSQLALLVTAYTNPRVSEAVALEIAGGLLDTDLLSKTSAIPAELVELMAMAVAEESPTDIEVEQLELDLRRAFERASRTMETGSEDHEALVRELAESRRARKAAASDQAKRAADSEARRVELEFTRRDAEAAAARRAQDSLQGVVADQERLISELRSATASERLAGEEAARNLARRHRIDMAALIVAFGSLAFLLLGYWFSALFGVVGAALVWVYGREWANGRASRSLWLVSVVMGVATVGPVLIGLLSNGDETVPPTVPTTTTTISSR